MNRQPSPRLQSLTARVDRLLAMARYNGGVLRRVDGTLEWYGRWSDRRRAAQNDVLHAVNRGYFVLTGERDGTPRVTMTMKAPIEGHRPARPTPFRASSIRPI